jgi:hypothetical protein
MEWEQLSAGVTQPSDRAPWNVESNRLILSPRTTPVGVEQIRFVGLSGADPARSIHLSVTRNPGPCQGPIGGIVVFLQSWLDCVGKFASGDPAE